MSEITIQNLSYYHGKDTPYEIKALEDINLNIQKGTMTGIIGHTGSGKSTLVQMFNGILKPFKGKVLLDGDDIWSNPKDIRKIRFRVGLVMQYPEHQLFEETVYKDIAFGPHNMGLSQEEVDACVREAAEFAGISSELLERSPFDLSGGRKRRVVIAGIIAMRPDVLVLDEPAAGLDPRGRDSIFQNIKNYQQKSGKTVVVVSHSMEDMARYAENIVVMKDARVLKTGTVADIFSEGHILSEAGLNTPVAFKLSEELARRGISLSGELYTVEGVARAVMRALKK